MAQKKSICLSLLRVWTSIHSPESAYCVLCMRQSGTLSRANHRTSLVRQIFIYSSRTDPTPKCAMLLSNGR